MWNFDTSSLNIYHDSDWEYLNSESENPFARIACRSRRMTPTLCDGTCWNCKKEREQFLISEPERMLQFEKANPRYWADLDEFEVPTIEEKRRELQNRLERIEAEKKEIIQERRKLLTITTARIAVLEKLALSPETHPWNTLH